MMGMRAARASVVAASRATLQAPGDRRWIRVGASPWAGPRENARESAPTAATTPSASSPPAPPPPPLSSSSSSPSLSPDHGKEWSSHVRRFPGLLATFRDPELTAGRKAAKALAWCLGFYARGPERIRMTQGIYRICYKQAELREFHDLLRLPDRFLSWFYLTQLHVWMVMVRLRSVELPKKEGKAVQQDLFDIFMEDVQHRVRMAGVVSDTTFVTSSRELLALHYGASLAYEEGLLTDDAVIVGALWRNICQLNEDVTAHDLRRLVAYIRRELRHLDSVPDEHFVSAEFGFGRRI